jgi:hypothetical protein
MQIGGRRSIVINYREVCKLHIQAENWEQKILLRVLEIQLLDTKFLIKLLGHLIRTQD